MQFRILKPIQMATVALLLFCDSSSATVSFTLNYKITPRAAALLQKTRCEAELVNLLRTYTVNPNAGVFVYHSQQFDKVLKRLGATKSQEKRVLDWIDQAFTIYYDDPIVQTFVHEYQAEETDLFLCVLSKECIFRSKGGGAAGYSYLQDGKNWYPGFVLFPANLFPKESDPESEERLLTFAGVSLHERKHHFDRVRINLWLKANNDRKNMNLSPDPIPNTSKKMFL